MFLCGFFSFGFSYTAFVWFSKGFSIFIPLSKTSEIEKCIFRRFYQCGVGESDPRAPLVVQQHRVNIRRNSSSSRAVSTPISIDRAAVGYGSSLWQLAVDSCDTYILVLMGLDKSSSRHVGMTTAVVSWHLAVNYS